MRLNRIIIARKGKITMGSFFYSLLCIYIINQVFSESQFKNIPPVSNVLAFVRYSVIGCLLLIIVYRKITVNKAKVVLLPIILLLILINLITVDGGLSFFPVILFAIASERCSLSKIFKCVAISLVISHIVVIVCAEIGILQDVVEFRYIGNYSGSVLSGAYYRHNMGFLVHNQIPLAFLFVYLYMITIYREHLTIVQNVFFMTLNFLIFKSFGSRIVFLLSILSCIFYYMIKIGEIIKVRSLSRVFNYSYIICAIISLVMALAYKDNIVWRILNLISNNRIIMSYEAINLYGIRLLGSGKQAVDYSFVSNITIDNGYINVLIGEGLLLMVFIIGVWTRITTVLTRKNNKYLTMVVVFLALENLVNTHLSSFKLIPFFCILFNYEDSFLNCHYMDSSTYRKLMRLKKDKGYKRGK